MFCKAVVQAVMAGLVLIGLSITSGCSFLPKEEGQLAPPLLKPVEEPLNTAQVRKGTIRSEIQGQAIVESTSVSYYSLNTAGRVVKSVYVRAGDKVRKGDLLIELDSEGLEIEEKRRELALLKAQYALEDAKNAGDKRGVRTAELEVSIANAELLETRKEVRASRLVSDRPGEVVFTANLKPGDIIKSAAVVAAVADPSQLRLAYEGEREAIAAAKVGMIAHVDVEGQSVAGRVVQTPSSAPKTEDEEVNALYARTLYIAVDSFPAGTRIGTLADFTIVANERTNVLTIPLGGIKSAQGRQYVQVLEGDSIREADIETGIKTATEAEVLKGLTEGQHIIVP